MAKHRIRNLRKSSNELQRTKSKCCRIACLIVLAVITCVLGILMYNDEHKTIARRLREHVDRQYLFHLYGKMDYCDQNFQPTILIEALKLNVINQQDALDQISIAIENLGSFTSLALVGGSGVGKTLTCNILVSKFQWDGNVFYYIWSAIDSPSSQCYKIFKTVTQSAKKCGAHLVIVDNIGFKDSKAIEELNIEIQKEFTDRGYVILIIYVFNLATYSNEDLETLDEKRLRLHNLNGIISINFRSFNRNDVEDCISLESRKLNVVLSKNEIEDLLQHIDGSRSGCKLIYSKVVMYTRRI